MSKEMMDALYMEHSEKIGVLSSNEREVVSQVEDFISTVSSTKKIKV